MNDELLTAALAARVFGWRPAADRFLKPDRSWVPRWRFRPLAEVEDALRLLDHATDNYTLTRRGSVFSVEVRIKSRRGKAVGEKRARTITAAVASALGLEVEG